MPLSDQSKNLRRLSNKVVTAETAAHSSGWLLLLQTLLVQALPIEY
jgi:hypothetical protein